MNEMIDRVELVLREYQGEASLRFIARAAIAAMREPTDSMCEAGAAYYHDNFQAGHAKEQTTAPLIWREMIDTALKD